MKSLFRFCSFFLALACLLSSCSKNDIPKNEQEEEDVADGHGVGEDGHG